jgi:hypothetical protein
VERNKHIIFCAKFNTGIQQAMFRHVRNNYVCRLLPLLYNMREVLSSENPLLFYLVVNQETLRINMNEVPISL